MKLEQNDKSMLFSSTELPDVFFAEYLSGASGDYIKVYLYIVFLSKYGKDIKITDLSKKLDLPFGTVQEAITYWEKQGALTKKTTGYVVNSLQEKELLALYNPKITMSPEELTKSAENRTRIAAIESINNMYFQGIMMPTWYNDIDMWFRKYGFDEQVMISLFGYCFEKSKLHRNYVQAVADAWHKNNVKTFTDLENYSQKQEKLNIIRKSVSKKLGLNRPLTQFEDDYIRKWYEDFGYNQEIIDIALKKTTSKANPSFDYINKLLSDWHKQGLKTPSEVLTYLEEKEKQSKKVPASQEKKSGFQSYDQRKYDNLDKFYANNDTDKK